MLKLLHIADIHLDTSFYSKSEELRRKLRDGIRKSFSNAIDLSIDKGVNALLIAGDLFDSERLSFRTEQFLIKEFQRLNEHNIKVFYSTGNHDPGHSSYRVNSINWPENVFVFKEDNVEEKIIYGFNKEPICKIISCGHKTNKEGRNLTKEFPVKNGDMPHIGLLHTMVSDSKDLKHHHRYLPCNRRDLEEKKYDYWALGHIHKRQRVSKDYPIYYPGNIQGRHPREMGPKGGLLVTINDDNIVKTQFEEFSPIQWHTLKIDGLEDIKDYQGLKIYIEKQIIDHIEERSLDRTNLIMRIELEDRAYLKQELQSEENIKELIENLSIDLNLLDLEIRTDNLLSNIVVDEYRERDHVLSLVLSILDNIEENEILLDKILNIPMANKGITSKDERLSYIKELLYKLDEEAVNWMVGDLNENY